MFRLWFFFYADKYLRAADAAMFLTYLKSAGAIHIGLFQAFSDLRPLQKEYPDIGPFLLSTSLKGSPVILENSLNRRSTLGRNSRPPSMKPMMGPVQRTRGRPVQPGPLSLKKATLRDNLSIWWLLTVWEPVGVAPATIANNSMIPQHLIA